MSFKLPDRLGSGPSHLDSLRQRPSRWHRARSSPHSWGGHCDSRCNRRPDRREYVAFKTANHVCGMDRCPLRPGILIPLARYPFERLPTGFERLFFLQLLGDRRVAHAFGHGEGFVSLQASLGERHFWPGAERHSLLLAIKAVAPSPQFASCGRDEQIEAIGIGQFVGFRARLCGPDLDVREHGPVSKSTTFFDRAYHAKYQRNRRMLADRYGRSKPS